MKLKLSVAHVKWRRITPVKSILPLIIMMCKCPIFNLLWIFLSFIHAIRWKVYHKKLLAIRFQYQDLIFTDLVIQFFFSVFNIKRRIKLAKYFLFSSLVMKMNCRHHIMHLISYLTKNFLKEKCCLKNLQHDVVIKQCVLESTFHQFIDIW